MNERNMDGTMKFRAGAVTENGITKTTIKNGLIVKKIATKKNGRIAKRNGKIKIVTITGRIAKIAIKKNVMKNGKTAKKGIADTDKT